MPAASCRLSWAVTCGCSPACLSRCPGVEVMPNAFGWVRHQYVEPPAIKTGADLVGTSLVESGVVKATPTSRA